MTETETLLSGATLPVVIRECERSVRRSPLRGEAAPRRSIRRSEWIIRIGVPLISVLLALVYVMSVGGRQWRVELLLFWVLAGLGTYLGRDLPNLLARVTVSDDEVILRLRYTLQARIIPRREVRRLVRCTVRGGFGGRYPLLVVAGDGDRTLAQIEVDHYTDDDLAAIADALSIPPEGNWEYMPSVTEMIALFPGFRRLNPSANAAILWWILPVALAALLAWALTPVILR